MKKNIQHQKRNFNHLLLRYNKIVGRLQRLIADNRNVRKQNILKKQLAILQSKLVMSHVLIRKTIAIASLGGVLMLSNSVEAQIEFKKGLAEHVGKIGNYGASPRLVDLDNDGDLDILSGSINGNNTEQIFYSENIGTASEPEFTKAELNTFGLEFSASYFSAALTLADLDNDGDLDVIVAEYYGGAFYFENIGTASSPSYSAGQSSAMGLPSMFSAYSPNPKLVDIDNDGDFDLFVGNDNGSIDYFENTGTASAASFASSQSNAFGITSRSGYVTLDFSDLDNDGDLDLIRSGSTLDFLENTGSMTSPSFDAPQLILGTSPAYPSQYFPTFGDLDNDGDLDFIHGMNIGHILYYENTGSASAFSFTDRNHVNPFGLAVEGTSFTRYPFPDFVDLDNDGDQDLLQGRMDGDFYYSENIGTATAPMFGPAALNPFGITKDGMIAAPTFADLDGDGDMDLLAGHSVSPNPFLRYFENIGTASVPSFGPAQSAEAVLGIVYPQGRPKPTFVDLDNDGDQDLMVGNSFTSQDFIYFENIGTTTAPSFGAPQINAFGLATVVNMGIDVCPAFNDVDEDGDLDMVLGMSGQNFYYENIGTSTLPSFAAPLVEVFGLDYAINAPSANGWSTPTFVDIDGDGDADLISGMKNLLYWHENVTVIGSSIGVDENNNLSVNVYPNPSTGLLTFVTAAPINSITIFNLTGQQVSVFNNENMIDISHLPSGIYTATIQTKSGKTTLKKLVKE